MTQHQTGIECGHSMGNDKSHALPFALHHRGTVYLPWVNDFIYPSLWPIYAMIIVIEWRTPDLDLVYQVLFLHTYINNQAEYKITLFVVVNPLTGTLKPQSNGPLYSNAVIDTLAVDGWAVTFGTARRDLDRLGPRPVPSLMYQM